MTDTLTRTPVALREAFYEFSLAYERPDPRLLDDFVRRYPEYATEFTEFAIERALDHAFESNSSDSTIVSDEENEAVTKAMSRFYNRLYSVQQAQAIAHIETRSATPLANPFSTLDRFQVGAFCKRMQINSVFLIKLRDRHIEARTMTLGFLERIACELPAAYSIVTMHFNAPTEFGARASYKADSKPTIGAKQAFEEAVRSSDLTKEQQDFLLSL